jgi:hypothetical protein
MPKCLLYRSRLANALTRPRAGAEQSPLLAMILSRRKTRPGRLSWLAFWHASGALPRAALQPCSPKGNATGRINALSLQRRRDPAEPSQVAVNCPGHTVCRPLGPAGLPDLAATTSTGGRNCARALCHGRSVALGWWSFRCPTLSRCVAAGGGRFGTCYQSGRLLGNDRFG